MANNETIAEREEAMVLMAEAAAEKFSQVVNGDVQTDVLIDSGLVPSLAKQAVQAQEKVTAALEEVASGLSGAMSFTTTAKGLLATQPGELFGVLSPSNKKYVDIYENVANVAVPTGKNYPSSLLVEAMEAGDFSAVGLKMSALPAETGYAWAVVDTAGRAALLIRLDGTVEIPKFGPSKFFATELDPESGYVWAVVDAAGRIALGIKTDGTVVARLADLKIDGLQVLRPTTDVWCLGDSLTGAVYNRLASTMTDRKVIYGGAGGQTSVQIAARAGGTHALLSVTGNSIPASGAVAITALSTPLLSQAANTGTSTLMGWLSGVYGSLICAHGASDSLDTYSFTRAVPGSPTYCIPDSPFIPDTEALTYGVPIIFMGSNNPSAPEQVKADIEALVNQGPIVNKRFLILTPVMGGPLTPGQSTTSGVGSDTYNGIKAVEEWATKKYGDRVLKIREWSAQFHNGSADDLDDIAKGVVPRSLRTDGIHWIASFSNQVADLVKNEIVKRGW